MKKSTIVQLVIIGLILVIIGIAAYRLIRWNNGAYNHEDTVEQIDPSEFDVEVLDMIIPMESSRFEGHEDDGELTILCIGNNPFTDDRSSKGLANLIGEKTNGKVIDIAFPHSSTCYHNVPISPSYPWDHYNLPSIGVTLLSGEFKPMESAYNYVAEEEKEIYRESIDAIKNLDMNKVDILVIMYDSTDYNLGMPCDNEEVPTDLAAFTGGLRYFLDTVNENWPFIRTFVMTPTYAEYLDEDGKLYSGTTKDIGNGSLPYYVQKEIDATIGCGCSLIDNYYGTINEGNYKEYMVDHMHYNDAGRELLADRIAYVINNNMITVKSPD